MPPKRAPSKGKGSKGKGAKGKVGAAGKKGKGKKVNKKYAHLTFEDKFIAYETRDKLEVIAEALQSQMDCEREERIRYQTEADYFNELNSVYMPKLRCLQVAHELNQAKIIRMKQDVEDQEGIKRQEAKHFRYEAQLRLSQGQMKDHLRRKRIRKRLEKFWKFNCIEDELHAEKIEHIPEYFMAGIEKTREQLLGAFPAYLARVEGKRDKYSVELQATCDHLREELMLLYLVEEFEVIQEAHDLMCEAMNAFEMLHVVSKDYYLQEVHNSLNVIVIMCDHWDDMDLEERAWEKIYEKMEVRLELQKTRFQKLQYPYTKARIHHDSAARLRKGLVTTYKGLRRAENDLSRVMNQYRLLTHKATAIDSDSADFFISAQEVGTELWDGYANRFKIKGRRKEMKACQATAQMSRDRQRQFFRTEAEADIDFYTKLDVANGTHNKIEMARERSERVLKQHDDMWRALRGRLVKVGKCNKHPLKFPIRPVMIGKMHGLGPQPAGLVAKKFYKKRPRTPEQPRPLPYCGEEDHYV